MKKFICAVILVILAFVMCSCSDNAENSDSQSTSLSQEESGSPEFVYRNEYKMPWGIEGKDIEGFEDDKLIFIAVMRSGGKPFDYSSHFHTILHTHNDKEIPEYIRQSSEGESRDYVATRNKIFTEDITDIMVNDYYDKESYGYDGSKNAVILRTNADWNIAPWKVKYTNYCQENKKPKDSWVKAMEEALDEETGGTDTPIIIWESWSFDYNGETITFVNATNFADEKSLENWNYPLDKDYVYKDNDIVYSASAVFRDNEMTWFRMNLEYYYVTDVREPDKERQNACQASSWYLYQIDDASNIIQCPLYVLYGYGYEDDISDLNIYSRPDIACVLDMDNDKEPEIIMTEVIGLTKDAEFYEFEDYALVHTGSAYPIFGASEDLVGSLMYLME